MASCTLKKGTGLPEERGGGGGGVGRSVNGQLRRRREDPLKLHVLMMPWLFLNDLMYVERVLFQRGWRVNGQPRRRGEGPLKITCSHDAMVVFK